MVVGATSYYTDIDTQTLAKKGSTCLRTGTFVLNFTPKFRDSLLGGEGHPNVKREILTNPIDLLQGGLNFATLNITILIDGTSPPRGIVYLILLGLNLLPPLVLLKGLLNGKKGFVTNIGIKELIVLLTKSEFAFQTTSGSVLIEKGFEKLVRGVHFYLYYNRLYPLRHERPG